MVPPQSKPPPLTAYTKHCRDMKLAMDASLDHTVGIIRADFWISSYQILAIANERGSYPKYLRFIHHDHASRSHPFLLYIAAKVVLVFVLSFFLGRKWERERFFLVFLLLFGIRIVVLSKQTGIWKIGSTVSQWRVYDGVLSHKKSTSDNLGKSKLWYRKNWSWDHCGQILCSIVVCDKRGVRRQGEKPQNFVNMNTSVNFLGICRFSEREPPRCPTSSLRLLCYQ